MANVNNAFAALLGAGEAISTSSKKKNKSKAKAAPEQNGTHAAPLPTSAPVAASNGHAATHSVVDVSEAIPILERAAREARSIADKNKLWKEWSKQVSLALPAPPCALHHHEAGHAGI